MEGRMCKICDKVFSNGRALGGHMRSHLVTLPLPWKKPIQLQLIQEDRESETEVTRKTNPTRKRSKRARVTPLVKEVPSMSSELEPVMSSVSDQISAEEDVALCLMMLSRDVWSFINLDESSRGQKRSKYQCETCDKVFDSFQALGGHKTSHRKIENDFTGVGNKSKKNVVQDDGKSHECPFCYRVFGSGQALGGHKRSHVSGSSTTATDALVCKVDGSVNLVHSTKAQGNLVIIDLNLPAPTEDEENSSAVSDAEFYQSPLQL
ncbi:zinc finger protein ZAT1-like [Cynara cardunculus var. scolymus]|uniref:zinc finger protein ZAT1-like n=1 Tax=Cynara cardunculus var. scolymus TaxID=59895 RepID=UPI000D62AA53|nr:zinc finger protein ZAT1-like [Cynara cardunculus var. scolymus]